MPGRGFGGDLRVTAGQPWRGSVRRGAENDSNPTLISAGEHRLEPIQVEPPVLRLPGGPDRFPDPNDRKAGFSHQVQVHLEARRRLVLVVIRRAEERALPWSRGPSQSGALGHRE